MKKYIRLKLYFYNDSTSSIETIRPVLIDIDRIRVVLHSETGSIVSVDNGESMNVVETIEEIKNMLDIKI